MAKKDRRPAECEVVEVSIREGNVERQKELAERYSNITWQEIDSLFVDLEKATVLLSKKRSGYVRLLLLSGRIEGVKVQMKGFAKWYVDLESIDYYNETKGQRRSIRRYILRIPPESEGAIREILDRLVTFGGEELQLDLPGNFNYTLDLAYTGSNDDEE